MRRKYAGTPLLWNRAWFGDERIGDGTDRRMSFEQSDWSRYVCDQAVQKRVNFRVGLTLDIIRQIDKPRQIVALNCGDALVLHLLATQGIASVGIDRRADCIALAERCMAKQNYPADRPQLMHQTDAHHAPLPDGKADMVVLFDALERHPNPVALLAEARRVLAVGKPLLITAQRKDLAGLDPSAPEQIKLEPQRRRLMWHELGNLIGAAGGFQWMMKPQDDPSRDMVLLLKRAAPAVGVGDVSKVA